MVATLTFKDPVPPFPYWGKYINPSQIDFCAELRPDPTVKNENENEIENERIKIIVMKILQRVE